MESARPTGLTAVLSQVLSDSRAGQPEGVGGGREGRRGRPGGGGKNARALLPEGHPLTNFPYPMNAQQSYPEG